MEDLWANCRGLGEKKDFFHPARDGRECFAVLGHALTPALVSDPWFCLSILLACLALAAGESLIEGLL